MSPTKNQKPLWLGDGTINEVLFCREFLKQHPMCSLGGSFFTKEGKVSDEGLLKKQIYEMLKPYISTRVTKRVTNLLDVLRMECCCEDLPVQQDRIHMRNGTLFLDGCFSTNKEYCRNRLAVDYNPNAAAPEKWLSFLGQLLEEEDIPTLQEYLGYCLIPSTKAQKMLILLGNGGEGKSRIGLILERMLGESLIMDSLQKIETNRFARADLEHRLLMVDDDLDMNALPKTNYLKSIVTAETRMDLEKKGSQSYQGQLYVRFLCFGNGALTSVNDHSHGFYRRQLVLYTKAPAPNRRDDPFLAEKLAEELEGIFLWCLEGLQRLIANHFQFTVSTQTQERSDSICSNANSVEAFLFSTGYFEFHADAECWCKYLYDIYCLFCEDNAFRPISSKQLTMELNKYAKQYNLESTNNIYLRDGRRVRGFLGIEPRTRILF